MRKIKKKLMKKKIEKRRKKKGVGGNGEKEKNEIFFERSNHTTKVGKGMFWKAIRESGFERWKGCEGVLNVVEEEEDNP